MVGQKREVVGEHEGIEAINLGHLIYIDRPILPPIEVGQTDESVGRYEKDLPDWICPLQERD